MTRKLALLATAALLGVAADVRGQFIGPPYPGPPVLVPGGGIGFQYSGHRLKVAGFVPVGPGPVLVGPPFYPPPGYAIYEKTIIVQPTVIVPAPRVLVPYTYDLSGIDLDLESPDRLFPPGTAPAAPKLAARPVEPKPAEPKKPPPEPPKPPVVAKPDPPPMKAPADDLLEPRAAAPEESRRLLELGLRAFRAGEYGLAAWRFKQATEVDPAHARAFFLLGQAYLAVGQYRDAVTAIQDGLRLRPDWPTTDFRPRLELYDQDPDDFAEHRRRLDETVKRQPQQPAYLFLRGYVAWFDGQRPQAAQWFLQARPLTDDPRWIDLFLKLAPLPPVAAK